MSKSFKTLCVLVVDGDRFSRGLLRDVLEGLGLLGQNILRVGDGLEALELLRAASVDIVICDRQMGAIDGVEFVRKLRDPNESPTPGVPIIFCSHQLDRQLVEAIREAGVNEAAIKPITHNSIESRIRQVLEKPRPIVDAADYTGPDRRRVKNDDIPRERRSKAIDI